MVDVRRTGFTLLTPEEDGSSGSPTTKRVNIIFVHGLRGHPKNTWGRGVSGPSPSDEDGDGSNGADAHSDITGAASSSSSPSPSSTFSSSAASSSASAASSVSLWRMSSISRLSRRSSSLSGISIRSMMSMRSLGSMGSLGSLGSGVSGSGKPPTPFWPDEFLRDDLPEARVWTYGYNANVFEGLFAPSNKHGIEQHGDDLAIMFGREIENEDPVIWVAHGLGGIIVKDALRKSEACQARTKKLIFLGTPHQGSRPAGWSKLALGLARLAMQDVNHKLVESLEEDSELLGAIHVGFVKVAVERGIKVHSFYEGRGTSGLKGYGHKVVEDSSAKANLPQELEVVESLDASHRGMTRAVDKDDMVYRSILSIIKRFVRPLCPEEDEKDAQKPEPGPESKPEPKPEAEAEAEVGPEAEAEPEAGPKPEAEPKSTPEPEPEAESELQPEAKLGPEPASPTDVIEASEEAEQAAGDEPDPEMAYTVEATGAQDEPSASTPRSTNWEVLGAGAEGAGDELDDHSKGGEGDKSSPSVAVGNEQNTKQEDVSVPTIKVEDADALKAEAPQKTVEAT